MDHYISFRFLEVPLIIIESSFHVSTYKSYYNTRKLIKRFSPSGKFGIIFVKLTSLIIQVKKIIYKIHIRIGTKQGDLNFPLREKHS